METLSNVRRYSLQLDELRLLPHSFSTAIDAPSTRLINTHAISLIRSSHNNELRLLSLKCIEQTQIFISLKHILSNEHYRINVII